jgi:integrase
MGHRAIHRLSDRRVRTAPVGLHCDGGGLYLQVTEGAEKREGGKMLRRSWLFRFATGEIVTSGNGKPRQIKRDMGLGALDTVGLAEARERAADARKLREQGKDPIVVRDTQRAAQAAAGATAMTFDQCRDRYIAAHRAGWRNAKHADQWKNTLETCATPVFGNLPVDAVGVGHVIKVLEPLWSAKPETASRVRGRIELILDWAKVRGFRDGENPARWRGHLDKLLPKVAKAKRALREQTGRAEHHAALPYQEMATFLTKLREREAVSARALEFAVLTAGRTGEVIGARWDEIDLANKIWTVPEGRMKGGRKHRVPLSDAAIAIVEEMRTVRQNEYLFPGDQREQLSNMALLMLLRRMDYKDITAHGFRATFKTWAEDLTDFPREMIEVALAHGGGKLEEAYNRGDLFDKRRHLMTAWGEYCDTAPVTGDVASVPPAE